MIWFCKASDHLERKHAGMLVVEDGMYKFGKLTVISQRNLENSFGAAQSFRGG
jgi:hypothetical protein